MLGFIDDRHPAGSKAIQDAVFPPHHLPGRPQACFDQRRQVARTMAIVNRIRVVATGAAFHTSGRKWAQYITEGGKRRKITHHGSMALTMQWRKIQKGRSRIPRNAEMRQNAETVHIEAS